MLRSHLILILLLTSFSPLLSEEMKKPEKETEMGNAPLPCFNKDVIYKTNHEITINGQKIAYTATVGMLIMKDDKCNPKASAFYISYSKNEDDKRLRPISFCFNGGPGSSSVWLHMGMLGPKRADIAENGDTLPPYKLLDNEYSLLDTTDLVFIDPVSTGFSHSIPFDNAQQFHSVEEDIKFFGEFIRLYLTKNNRWESPKFIIGESYGTTRAAGLAEHLHNKENIYINGLVLISSVLNFQSIDFTAGNDMPFLLFLPSYTATAWYHKKLAPELQENLVDSIDKARDFVINEYSSALFKGDLISDEEKQLVVKKLAYFTGLSQEYIQNTNLRIDMFRYAKELLRSNRRTVGRFDGRFLGIDADAVGEHTEYDPSIGAVFGAFTASLNQYLRTDLKWPFENRYSILSNLQWDFGSTNQYLNVAENLRSVMTKNPFLTVFVANGYYDLATPFFATEYTFNHLGLDPSLLSHVSMKYYESGHMMYTNMESLRQLKTDLSSYYKNTLKDQLREEKSASQL
jgi:carboxypeptidase C (cathepsin A)